MKKIDLTNWKRKEHFDFFSKMASPTFGIVTEVDCDECFKNSKENDKSFFANYLHKSMIAVNSVDELKYRIIDNEIIEFEKIHAGITIGREDETFGFGFVNFSSDFETFNAELENEILAVKNCSGLRLNNDDIKKDLIRHSTIPWNSLPDSTGFIYLQFPVTDIDDPNFKRNTQSVLYNIGDDPNDVKILMSAKTNPELNIQSNDYPIVTITSKDSPYTVAYIASVENFWDSYVVPIDQVSDQLLSWKSFYSKEDMVYTDTGVFSKGDYVYISALRASNLNISKVSLEILSFKNPEILIAEKDDEVIDEFVINKDGLFYSTIKNGVEGKLYSFSEGVSQQVSLPSNTGKASLSTPGNNSGLLWVTLSG